MVMIKLTRTLSYLALPWVCASSALAADFSAGPVNIIWNNSIGYGVGMRLEERDTSTLMAGNAQRLGLNGTGASYNYDDGNLNYDQYDVITHVAKFSTDLEISYSDYGAFIRARGFYDTAIMDNETRFKPLPEGSKNAAGGVAELLDAYVWADMAIWDIPISLRVGRQVLSWGESTFILGGINSINPIDAPSFRKPGAEVKDAMLPVNMVFTSIGLTADLTLEAFYQLQWEKTRSDACGTFFSSVDFVANGCGPVILGGTSDEQTILAQRDQDIANNVPARLRTAPVTERLQDATPKDEGQFGLALRWYSEWLGNTEFGLYYLNLHSRLPFINGVVTNYDKSGTVTKTPNAQVNANATYDSFNPLYQISYPEDIQIIGLTFATTTESGLSLSGEISYKPDAPVQWNAFELLLAGNGFPGSRLYQQRVKEAGLASKVYGELAQGYDNLDIIQMQMTAIALFDRVLGADRLVLVGEVGANFLPDLPSVQDARYGRSGIYGSGNNDGVWSGNGEALKNTNWCLAGTNPVTGSTNNAKNANADYCTDEGYVTQWSGGIRGRMLLTYNGVLSGLDVTPKVSVAYDQGNGPEPGSQFTHERLTLGLGVQMLYRDRTSMEVAYTNYSGGRYNPLKDRDNIALSVSYTF